MRGFTNIMETTHVRPYLLLLHAKTMEYWINGLDRLHDLHALNPFQVDLGNSLMGPAPLTTTHTRSHHKVTLALNVTGWAL